MNKVNQATIIIGPEGGLSDQEIANANAQGAQSLLICSCYGVVNVFRAF